ncbi:MAG: thioredoxin family protein [Proteobacteria bacterium]|nr:thioredoxin family protein [Pseudomonadota bacterium]MBU1714716.1 thioredoxin family protein [Pseudomonadota bacterium]
MKKLHCFILIGVLCSILACASAAAQKAGEVVAGIPVKDTVTLVDLGAKTCIPCKLMAPILEELGEAYQGRAEIIFIDVWDPTNEGKAKAFKVRTIPTQIFYDKQGKEVYRHLGFLDKTAIIVKLEELLAE